MLIPILCSLPRFMSLTFSEFLAQRFLLLGAFGVSVRGLWTLGALIPLFSAPCGVRTSAELGSSSTDVQGFGQPLSLGLCPELGRTLRV